MLMRSDRDVTVNFEPVEYMRKMIFLSVKQAKKIRMLLIGVEPKTWLLVQMLYH